MLNVSVGLEVATGQTVDVDLHPGSGKCEWFLAVFSLNKPVGYTIAY